MPAVKSARGIDHLVLAARDLDALAQFFRHIGFAVGARNRHPWGTRNHIVQFDGAFIELIGVEPGLLALVQGMFGRFGGHIGLGWGLVTATAVGTVTLVTGHAVIPREVWLGLSGSGQEGTETEAKPGETTGSIPEVHRITLPLLLLAAGVLMVNIRRHRQHAAQRELDPAQRLRARQLLDQTGGPP